jgi:hypothetical protein
MGYSVTSWFVDQTSNALTEPKKIFTLGSSDFSSRVDKWPTLKKTINDLRPVNPRITLMNQDGDLNFFIDDVSKIANAGSIISGTLDLGFTHPTSGDEVIRIYTGQLDDITFNKDKVTILLKDKLHALSERTVGTADAPTSYTADIPSDIAWNLLTVHGGLNSLVTSANPDIFWPSFQAWAKVFSSQSITTAAQYEGVTVREAIERLANYTRSTVWVDGLGRINFDKFITTSSLDIVLSEDELINLQVAVSVARLKNKHAIFASYNVDDSNWGIVVSDVFSSSVDSYGTREVIIKDETIWFVDSFSALSDARRENIRLSDAPKGFGLEMGLDAVWRDISESVRLVSSFYNITSATAFRMTELNINMHNAHMDAKLDTSFNLPAFILDVSTLDNTIEVLM